MALRFIFHLTTSDRIETSGIIDRAMKLAR